MSPNHSNQKVPVPKFCQKRCLSPNCPKLPLTQIARKTLEPRTQQLSCVLRITAERKFLGENMANLKAFFLAFIFYGVCFSSDLLLSTMGSGNTGTGSLSSGSPEIYVPGSGFFSPVPGAYDDLARPSVPILDLPPLPQVYNSGNLSYPQYYNHSNYLYGHYGYNYNMQAYPYMAYNANDANRNMGYLNTSTKQSTTQKTNFDGARLLHSNAKIDQEIEGKVSRENFLKAWIQFAGVTQSPPTISQNEVCAFITSKDASVARVVQNVKVQKKDNSEILVVEYKKENKASGSFYSDPQNEGKTGYISGAIFKNTDHKIEFVEIKSNTATATTTTTSKEEEGFFLDSGMLLFSLKDPRIIEDRNSLGALNYEILSDNDLVRLRKLNYDENTNFEKILRDINFEREVLYVTGRIYTDETTARRIGTRRISSIKDTSCNNSVRHQIIIKEDEKSKEAQELNSSDEKKAKEMRFRGHFVRTDRPKNSSADCPPQWTVAPDNTTK